jgi:hypothetical protein
MCHLLNEKEKVMKKWTPVFAVVVLLFCGSCFGAAPDGLLAGYPAGTTTDTVFEMSARSVDMTNAAGATVTVKNPNVYIGNWSVGANGFDGGATAASGVYYTYFIYDAATRVTAGLFSASSTKPVMPKGYTYKLLAGVVIAHDGFLFLEFSQIGNSWWFVHPQAVSLPAARTMTIFQPLMWIDNLVGLCISTSSPIRIGTTNEDSGWAPAVNAQMTVPMFFFYYEAARPASILVHGFTLSL